MPAVSERDRHDLYVAVQDQFGERHADTLMNLLPPVGWADVATKEDVRQLGERLDTRIDHVRTELHQLGERLTGDTRTLGERLTGDTRTLGERLDTDIGHVRKEIVELENRIGLRFDAVDLRFQALEQGLDARFAAVDDRFGRAEEAWELRFDGLEHRFVGMLHETKGAMHEAMHKQLRVLVLGLLGSFTSMMSLSIATIALA
jgi:uncharacterized protein YPO0396